MLLSHLRTSPIRIDKLAQIKHSKPVSRHGPFVFPCLKADLLAAPDPTGARCRADTQRYNSILNSNRSMERGPVQEPQTSTGPRYSKLARPKYSVLPHLRNIQRPPEGAPESPANPKAHDASNQILGLNMCHTHPQQRAENNGDNQFLFTMSNSST